MYNNHTYKNYVEKKKFSSQQEWAEHVVDNFINNNGYIRNHTYKFHVAKNYIEAFNSCIRDDKEVVSFFNDEETLVDSVYSVLVDYRYEITEYVKNNRRYEDLQLSFHFYEPIGFSMSDDDNWENNDVLVVVCKDRYTGKLIVKNAYPITL